MDLKEFKKRMWAIVCNEGIEITNQNIDWLLSRAEKEYSFEQEFKQGVVACGTPIKRYDCLSPEGFVSVSNIIYKGRVYFVVKTDFTISIVEELPNVYVRGNEDE